MHTMNIQTEKQTAALAALQYIETDEVLGVGSGSTVNIFIAALEKIKNKIAGAVASSKETAQRLKDLKIPLKVKLIGFYNGSSILPPLFLDLFLTFWSGPDRSSGPVTQLFPILP